jgi:hypothetical protein
VNVTVGGKAKNGGWRTQGDDLRTFLVDFVASVPQEEFSAGLDL